MDIVVIGGSMGAIEPLKTIVSGLPSSFPSAVFVVIHVSPDSPAMLALLLSNSGPLPAKNPEDGELIKPGHIYVAKPDHHIMIEDGAVRMLHGPRENRHRPAVDPLFRTAARAYGPEVDGVILSGMLDDGSAGLYAVKQRGGNIIVQDPDDAQAPQMPRNAIQYAQPRYVLPASEIAPLLVRLQAQRNTEAAMETKPGASERSNGRRTRQNAGSVHALSKPDANLEVAYFDEGEGHPSAFACPECHGVLWELKDEKMTRFRCRVGHSYGMESLSGEISYATEAALWAAVRALEEKAALSRRVAENMNERMSARVLEQAESDSANATKIRNMIFRQPPRGEQPTTSPGHHTTRKLKQAQKVSPKA